MEDQRQGSGLPNSSSQEDSQMHDMHDEDSVTSNGGVATKRRTRLRQACDACRLRKVKCDEEGPPCRACKMQGLLCAYTRARKKPGPPIRRALPRADGATNYPRSVPDNSNKDFHRDESSLSVSSLITPSVSPIINQLRDSSVHSPTPVSPFLQPKQELSQLHRPINTLRLHYQPDYLLPLDALKHLLEDYFIYIYPLVPCVHEASFWEDFRKERHRYDAEYLSLLFAMCACVVSSFPRRVQAYSSQYYESAGALLERAHSLSLATRPLDYRDNLTCEIVGSMYLLCSCPLHKYTSLSNLIALSAAYANIHPRSEVSLHEMLYCVKLLMFGHDNPLSTMIDHSSNLIDLELRKRIFWLAFVGERSVYSLIGPMAASFVLDYTPTDMVALQHNLFPKEIDDDFITETSYHEREMLETYRASVITGLNANSKLFLIYAKYVASTSRQRSGSWLLMEPELKMKITKSFLSELKSALDDLPDELVLDLHLAVYSRHPSQVPVPGPGTDGDPYSNIMSYLENGPPQPDAPSTHVPSSVMSTNTPMSTSTPSAYDVHSERRRKQFESQKANLYVSQLHLHSLILSDYANLVRCTESKIEAMGKEGSKSNWELEAEVNRETDYICRAMLAVAQQVLKIRGIAASILDDIRSNPWSMQSPDGMTRSRIFSMDQISEYLVAFLDLLSKLAGDNDPMEIAWLKGIREELP